MAMLLHRNGRTLTQLSTGLLKSGQEGVERRVHQLEQRTLIRIERGSPAETIWLTDSGRDVVLRIHAASQAIEADLLGKLEPAEGLAFKHLLRRFIVQTDSGLPHPWQDAS
jgi:3-hydroxy-9,10-secoandrosta-1,3,5(10)-triene-9,17-dione monooxygenase reductase component